MQYIPLEITFNNPEKVFIPGSTVSGYIRISNPTKKEISLITLTCKGRSSCSWFEQNVKKEKRKYIIYDENFKNTKTHFKSTVELYNPQLVTKHKRRNSKIGEKTVTYNFNYKLPDNLPSSYVGEYGGTDYVLIVNIYVPPRIYKKKETFKVTQIVDIRKIKGANKPLIISLMKYIGFWKFKSGPINARLRANRSGFLGGEVVPFVIEVNNDSKKNIQDVELGIIQLATYNSETPFKNFKETEQVVKVMNFKGVSAKNHRVINASFQIPNSIPSAVGDVIDISYKIELLLNLKGWYSNIVGTQPIYIGTMISKPKVRESMPSLAVQSESDEEIKQVNFTSVSV